MKPQAKEINLNNLNPGTMKNLVLFLTIFSLSLTLVGQEKKNQKIEPVGDLFEVTVYYDSGQIMQHGFLNKQNQLHASWESYYENGNRKCIATYDNGVKVGTWFYYYFDKKTKVVYDNNKIVEVEDLPLE